MDFDAQGIRGVASHVVGDHAASVEAGYPGPLSSKSAALYSTQPQLAHVTKAPHTLPL